MLVQVVEIRRATESKGVLVAVSDRVFREGTAYKGSVGQIPGGGEGAEPLCIYLGRAGPG